MITKPTDIPNCVIWLDASDKSTLSQTASSRPNNYGYWKLWNRNS